MTVLESLIAKRQNLSDPAAILAEMTEKNIKTIVTAGPISIAGVEKVYGVEFTIPLLMGMKEVLTTLRSAGELTQAEYLEVYFDRLKYGAGLDFSDDAVRLKLDSLIPLFGADTINKLKDLGAVYKSEWEIYGGATEPTLDEVQTAVTNRLAEINKTAWIEYVKNGILSNNGNGKTVAELKQLIAERE